jgi:alginate O-acetyltransferase complex protein AlgI
MVFSEPTFLFIFLPLFFLIYFGCGTRARNFVLLMASLVFYAWGEEIFVLILLASIALNYVVGLWISAKLESGTRLPLYIGVAGNLLLLAHFKYLDFLFDSLGISGMVDYSPHLPIGISFFTFQGISYLLDVASGRVKVQRDPMLMALYISMFPQLVAGPIVRYSEVEDKLIERHSTRSDFVYGVHRFIVGLAKKTLIADQLAIFVDQIFSIPGDGLTPELAWIGAAAFLLQIFFDFAAYSDMAIGIGKILGFNFPENFNYPFISKSGTEFWNRWHMTLSRWFRDYVFTSMLPRRPSALRLAFAFFVVFGLTGLWHGAAWNFVLWGLYNGLFLTVERLWFRKRLQKWPVALQHIYLIVMIIIGAVLFRATSLDQIGDFYWAMFTWSSGDMAHLYPMERYLNLYIAAVLIAAMVLSVPIGPALYQKLGDILGNSGRTFLVVAGVWALFAISVVSVGATSHSPFLYFRF